ncbi:MAG: photosynthetic protein synthase I, partial [Methylococcales bacterium]
MCTVKALMLTLAILLCSLSFQLFASDSNQPTLATGYGELAFTAPVPGTYQLPPLGFAADGKVVNTDNKDLSLYDLVGDKLVLLSFIYATCN